MRTFEKALKEYCGEYYFLSPNDNYAPADNEKRFFEAGYKAGAKDVIAEIDKHEEQMTGLSHNFDSPFYVRLKKKYLGGVKC